MYFKPPKTDSNKKSKIIPSPVTPVTLYEWSSNENAYFSTITTGLEDVCCRELTRKLNNVKIHARRGKIIFSTTDEPSKILSEIRSFDRVYALLDYRPTPTGPFEDSEESKQCILNLTKSNWKWTEALALWGKVNDELSSFIYDEDNRTKIKFRSTCKRGGKLTKQFGESPTIASYIGYEVNERFQWSVDLSNYNMEIYFHVNDEEAVAGILLGIPGQRHSGSGKGYLKPPVAFCMAEIANIQPGEVVLDPMCGTGMVLVEAIYEFSKSTYIGSDIDNGQINLALTNLSNHKCKHLMDVFHCDARTLPFKDQSIDKIISDVPFGKRHGSRFDNKALYPSLFHEWHRILKQGGKCVILTTNSKIMTNILMSQSIKWKMLTKHFVNLGGLDAFIYNLEAK